ncbi:phage tail tape measure protein [Notoacmeibacter marinus]|nr:phage tail tape measure protein [Notoacmeibacter marinus]
MRNAWRSASPAAITGISGPALGALGTGYSVVKVANAAIDFETALTGVQQKAGATDEQMKSVRASIMSIAKDRTVGSSMGDILGGFERAAAAGIPLDEMAAFVRVVSKGAPALDMTGEALGDTMSKLDGAGLVALKNAERFLDLTNALEDAGTSSARDILDFMLRAGAQGKIFGLAAEESAAIGTALVDIGVKSAEAGTAMNAILTKLANPDGLSERAQDAFSKLYKSTDEWQKLVSEDADEALVDLLDRLGKLDKATRSGVASDLFGLEHADIAQRLVEGLDKVRERLRLAKNEGAWLGNLDRTAALKLRSTQAQLDILKRQLAALVIDVGSMGLPALNAGLREAQNLVDMIDGGLSTFKAEIDLTAFEEARSAIGEISAQIKNLIGEAGGKGGIADLENVGRTLADVMNTWAKTIGAIDAIKDFATGEGTLSEARVAVEEAGRQAGDTLWNAPAVKTVRNSPVGRLVFGDPDGGQMRSARAIEGRSIAKGHPASLDGGPRARQAAPSGPIVNIPLPARNPKAVKDIARIVAPAKSREPSPIAKAVKPADEAMSDFVAMIQRSNESLARIHAAIPGNQPAQASAARYSMSDDQRRHGGSHASTGDSWAKRAAAEWREQYKTKAEVDTSDLKRVESEAVSAGAKMQSSLSVEATPQVNTSSIDAALSKAAQLWRYLNGSGSATTGQGGVEGRRASGGPVRAGLPYLVGEKGPEIAVFGRNSYVLPNHRLRGQQRSAGGVSGIGISLNAPITIHGVSDPQAAAVAARRELENAFDRLGRKLTRSRQISMQGRPMV